MLARFIIFGFVGWVVEVCFTGFHAALFAHDKSATAKTYLWMHPIYGAGMLALAWLGEHLTALSWVERALVYVAVIYAFEFATGWLLRRLLGHCPWDYGKAGLSVKGLIRLDYAPAWFLGALLFDPMRVAIDAGLHAVSVSQIVAAAVSGLG